MSFPCFSYSILNENATKNASWLSSKRDWFFISCPGFETSSDMCLFVGFKDLKELCILANDQALEAASN